MQYFVDSADRGITQHVFMRSSKNVNKVEKTGENSTDHKKRKRNKHERQISIRLFFYEAIFI